MEIEEETSKREVEETSKREEEETSKREKEEKDEHKVLCVLCFVFLFLFRFLLFFKNLDSQKKSKEEEEEEEEEEEPLISAVRKGDIDGVQTLLEKGANVESATKVFLLFPFHCSFFFSSF